MIPTLLPNQRDSYLGALNELLLCLSAMQSRPVDTIDFCDRHAIAPRFFDALRELGALEMDYTKPMTGAVISFKRTPALVDFTPEEVAEQMTKEPAFYQPEDLPPGKWIRFYDSRTNEFIPDDLSDTQVADEVPAYDIKKDFVRLGAAALKAHFDDEGKSDKVCDEAEQLRELARLYQRAAQDALQLAASVQEIANMEVTITVQARITNE